MSHKQPNFFDALVGSAVGFLKELVSGHLGKHYTVSILTTA